MAYVAAQLAFLLAASLPLLALALQPRADKKLVTLAETLGSEFAPERASPVWTTSDSDDGYIETGANRSLVFRNIVTGTGETFVDAAKLGFTYYGYSIQPSRENVLFSANYTKVYRHSYNASYFVYNRRTGAVTPLVDDQAGDIQLAQWSTKGNTIAFVRGNDLYIWLNGTVTRITNDGGPDMFNAILDWVYEEEIFSDTSALWFSPDGEYVTFLSMNETGVPTYTVPYYMAGQPLVAPPYPRELELRYPKVSETNPTVSLRLLQLGSWDLREIPLDSFAARDLIVGEVKWLGENHENVIVRTFNRVQDRDKHVLVDVATGRTRVVRQRDGADGWLDNTLAIRYVGRVGDSDRATYYLDLSDHTGWRHLYLYPVHGRAPPRALTAGQWEVVDILKVDSARRLVHYTSTERHPTERHVYSVSLATGARRPLTGVDVTKDGYWAASFSAAGDYYLLSYDGPGIPYQMLYAFNSSSVNGRGGLPLRTVTSNDKLRRKLADYRLPTTRYHVLHHPDGFLLNARETLPVGFDPSRRSLYPVLFDPYGGPGSQEVSKAYSLVSWQTYVASDPELQYIVLTVDNRGTGYQGRRFRNAVVRQLGKLEAADQIWAARQWARKPYVDPDHIAIWGWSYGGYLASKVIEADSGVFSLGLITAPVSDWRFYDSMYTERYMKTLEMNKEGYAETAVRKTAGFKNVSGGVLIQHGTGDDNVHFQNSAVLADILTSAGVSPEKMDVQWFTDSNHNINTNGARAFLFKQLSLHLFQEKNRSGRKASHQWSKRATGQPQRGGAQRPGLRGGA